MHGYKAEESQNYYTREQFEKYKKNFEIPCVKDDKPTICKLGPDFKIYDSKAYFLNVCQPQEDRLQKDFPFGAGFSHYIKEVKSNWAIFGLYFSILLNTMYFLL